MTQKMDPAFDAKRLCFKVISTWPGLEACRILEAKGVATLGTALFCMEQASLAGHVGCTYISPYYNELRVHIDKTYATLLPPSSLPIPLFSRLFGRNEKKNGGKDMGGRKEGEDKG